MKSMLMEKVICNVSEVDENNLIAVANGTRSIIKLNKETMAISLLVSENKYEKKTFNASIIVDDVIFAFSDWGKTIVKYDLDTKIQSVITLEDELSLGIASVYYVNERLYAFSCRRGIIYVINPQAFQIENEICIYNPEEANNIWNQMICYSNILYIPGGDTGCLYVYDVEKDTLVCIKILENESISTIAVSGSNLYISGRKKAIIYKCVLEDGVARIVCEWNLNESIQEGKFRLIQNIIPIENHAFVIPSFGNCIYKINYKEALESIIISNKKEKCERELWDPCIVYCGNIDNRTGLLFETMERRYYTMDLITGDISDYNLYIDKNEFAKIYKYVEGGIYQEDRFSLGEFLTIVSQG